MMRFVAGARGRMVERRVVDTNVVSLFLKEPPTADAGQYEPHLLGYELVISFMTLAELRRWAFERNWGARRVRNLEAYLAGNYAIHYADSPLCQAWARLMAECRMIGVGIDHSDCWIAATARELGLPLVTHNRRHFERLSGLQVISEAPDQPK
jgi:predicted nucleic acid-binding protein